MIKGPYPIWKLVTGWIPQRHVPIQHFYQWPADHSDEEVQFHQVCRWHQTGGNSAYAAGQGCHIKRPRHVWGTGQQYPHEIQQGQTQIPAPRTEELLAAIQTEDWWMGSSSVEKGLELWKTAAWAGSTLPAKRSSSIQGCSNKSSTSREGIITLHSSLVRSHLEYCVKFQVPQYKTDTDKPDQVQQRATIMVGSWRSCPVRRGWGSWDCSAWSKVGLMGTEQQPSSIWRCSQTPQPCMVSGWKAIGRS